MDTSPSNDPLSEKNFINEGYSQNPYPFWLWLFLLTIVIALAWGGRSWFTSHIEERVSMSPFLQVTNRDFSLFLWQNPEFMRVHAKNKEGYLTGFQYLDKVSLEPELAGRYVEAPPEVIFRYHTWHRLVSAEFSPRPIPLDEFREFLTYAEEWKPIFWPEAPPEYMGLISAISRGGASQLMGFDPTDMRSISLTTLPQVVRMAFQGWKNYFKEGELINQVKPTFGEMKAFIDTHPHYARNYWRNVVADMTPQYLQNLSTGLVNSIIPNEALSSFLKAAFFNFQESTKKVQSP